MNPFPTANPKVRSMSEPILAATNLSAGYGGTAVVRNIDIEVHPGEVVAILGANGAGKTTTMMTLAGALKPIAGEVSLAGQRVTDPLHSRARKGLAFVTQERSVFMNLTAEQNMRIAGDPERAVEVFPELREHRHRRAGLLSGGQQQMLTMGRALSREPKVLLADELSLGLAPLLVKRLLAACRTAAERGVGVILVEQTIGQALAFSDRAYIFRRGQVELEGPSKELAADIPAIQQLYLSGAEQPAEIDVRT